MSASRSGTRRTSRSIPTSPLAAISADEDVSPAAPRSWSATSSERSSSSSEHSSSLLSSNGSPICTVGRLAESSSPSSADASTDAPPIPSRPVRAPNSSDHVPDARRGAADQLVGLDQPDAHRVDQAVLLVRRLEVDLPADGGDADRVAVVPDARDRVLEQVAGPRRAQLAEAQRVEDRHRPRPDREDVAQDPADAGRRALERLDRARVVVRLDLERARHAVPDIDRPGVLARAQHELAALDRQRLEQPPRVLVAAVLGPHQAEDRELDLVRLAPHLLDDQVVLGVREPELTVAAHAGLRSPSRLA